MAVLNAFANTPINFDDLDLNWFWRNKVDADLSNGANYVYNNITYPDTAYVDARQGTESGSLLAGGTGFTSNGTGLTGGTITGLLELGASGNTLYTIERVSVSASAFQSALQSSSAADDRALLENAFSGDDYIYLSGGNDRVYGFTGKDVIFGGGGNDYLNGGAGDDYLSGNAGTDTMIGGTGDDKYEVDSTGDVVTEASNEGTDLVITSITYTLGENLDDLLLSGAGPQDGTGNALANFIIGNKSANVLRGLDGNDTFGGAGGGDTLYGGKGDDKFLVYYDGETIVENDGEGTDSVEAKVTTGLAAYVENLTLVGTGVISGGGNDLANVITGNDMGNGLSGNGGNDRIFGKGGADLISTGLGDDFVDGGAGTDIVDYSDDAFGSTAWFGNAAGPGDSLFAVETVRGSEFADTFHGNTSANAIEGRGGDDRIEGGGGADLLAGGAGDDIIDAGTGNDRVVEKADASGSDEIHLGDGNDTANLYVKTGDVLQVWGDAGTDKITVTGKTGPDGVVHIDTGADGGLVTLKVDHAVVIGGDGEDVVRTTVAPFAQQTFTLGLGRDTVRPSGTARGANLVFADFEAGAAGDVIDLTDVIPRLTGLAPLTNPFADGYMQLVQYGTDTLVQVDRDGRNGDLGFETLITLENIFPAVLTAENFGGHPPLWSWVFYGTPAPDGLIGTDNDDTIIGFAGNDTITGLKGNDRLEGGDGADTIFGNEGDDTLLGGLGNDTLTAGIGNDTLDGGKGTDILLGEAGNDTLLGGDGADKLTGGAGQDVLTGGTGADRFIFFGGDTSATRATADRITDFRHAEADRIDLKAIDARADLAGDQLFKFIAAADFTAAGQLRVITDGGNTYVEGNVNADLAADFVIRLDGTAPLIAADFVL